MSLADFFEGGDIALGVHDAAGAKRIAYALVHAVFERYFDVHLERVEHAYAHAVDDVVRARERLAPVGGGVDA